MCLLNVMAEKRFYSVAEELLPPNGDQKYTHRSLQYIQTAAADPQSEEMCHSESDY